MNAKCAYLLLSLLSLVVRYTAALPCMTPLGLKDGSKSNSLAFKIEVSSGDENNLRLNGPSAWIPQNWTDCYIEINISKPVLLTGMQVQGDPELTGRISSWALETSYDCENFSAENYSLDDLESVTTNTILLKSLEFVTCLRLRPQRYEGKSPALRLELLGCAVNNKNNRCEDDTHHPVTEKWIEGGGRELSFDIEAVLVWFKVLLKSDAILNTIIPIKYSRSCDHWSSYNQSDQKISRITALGENLYWVTVELEIPVRFKCLRIFPPNETQLNQIYTSVCSSYSRSSLQELTFVDNAEWNVTQKDAKVAFNVSAISTTVDTVPTDLPEEVVTTEPAIVSITKEFISTVNSTATIESLNMTLESTMGTTVADVPGATKNPAFGESGLSRYSEHPSFPVLSLTNQSSNNDNITFSTLNPSLSFNEMKNLSIYSTPPASVTTHLNTANRNLNTYNNTEINLQATEEDSDNNHKLSGEANGTSTITTNFNFTIIDNTRLADGDTHEVVSNAVNITPGFKDNKMSEQPYSTSTIQNLDLATTTVDQITSDDIRNKSKNETECGKKPQKEGHRRRRVIGGHMNAPGEWPWLVSMHYLIEFDFTRRSGFKHTCGASLIAPGWVITAAHCFSDELLFGLSNITCWRLYFGMHDLAMADNSQFVQERLIEAVYIYPKYNITVEPFLYDIALIKLNSPVELTETVSPVCLDDIKSLQDTEQIAFISGWGQTSVYSAGSRYPHTAALITTTLSRCKDMYDKLPDDNKIKKYVRIVPSILCAAVGTNGQDACHGDSGGPLMYEHEGRWYQAGIVSAGNECSNAATPGLYTRISLYVSWIRNTIELND